MDTCIRFVCFIENCSVRENGCKCVFSQFLQKVYGLFALHVNVGRLFFVFFLAYRHILITFVGTFTNQITDTTYNALTASVLMLKAQYTSYIYISNNWATPAD